MLAKANIGQRKSTAIQPVLAILFLLATGLGGCSGGLGLQSSPTPAIELTPKSPVLILADLVLREVALDYDSENPCIGLTESPKVRIKVANQGLLDADSFFVEVNQSRQFVAGLGAGQEIILWFSRGVQQTDIRVDVTFLVPESNERNNRSIRDLPFPTLAAGCLTPTPLLPQVEAQLALEGHSAAVLSVAFSPDGALVASGSVDNSVRMWQVNGGALLHTLRGHPFPVRAVRFSPSGALLATGSTDGIIRLWSVADSSLKFSLEGHAGWINGLAFSRDGQTLVSSAQDFTVRIWRVSDGYPLQTIDEGMAAINSITISSDGRLIGWCEDDGTVRLRLFTGEWFHILRATTLGATSLAFSADSQRLAVGFADGSMRVWNVEDGKLNQVLKSHTRAITGLSFSSDGRWLVSSSLDGTLRLWRVEEQLIQSNPVLVFTGHTGAVNSVAFSPLGNLIASGAEDGTVRLWLTPEE